MADATTTSTLAPNYPSFGSGNKLLPAPNPLEGAGQAIGVAQGMQNLSQSQFDLATKQMGALHNAFSSILQDTSPENITNRAVELKTQGVPMNAIQNGLGEFATAQAQAGNDPAAQKQAIQQVALRHIAQIGEFNQKLQLAGMGPAQLTPVGDALVPTTTRSGLNAGVYRAGGAPIALGMSPEAKAGRVATVGPDGTPISVPQSTQTDRRGLPIAQPAAPGSDAATSMAPAGMVGAPAGALRTGQAPGVGEAQKVAGGESGGQLAKDRDMASNYQQTVYPLTQAIPALERLGKTGTGPGTETVNNMKSFIQSLGLPGVDASNIKDYDEAKKYLTQYVNTTGNTGTNDKLAASFAGNPSTGISNAAAVDVAKSALSLRRMQQAKTLQFEQSGLPESQYATWASKWNTNQDPRAYGFDMMSADAQKKVISSLAPADKAKFVASLRAAHDSKLLGAPNAQQ